MKEPKKSRFRKYSLIFAESFDAWRIIPRTMLVMYSALVTNVYLWFKSIPTIIQEKCDPTIVRTILEAGHSMEEAKMFACTVMDVVGGPTAAQSAFVTTIIGLSTAIFGLYATTGRKWESGIKKLDHDPPSDSDTTDVNDRGDHRRPWDQNDDGGNGGPFPRR